MVVIIPCYNEQDNVEWVVDSLIENYPEYDYVVVNDGSLDSTASICRENGYNLLDLPINLGLAAAIQTGMRYALRKDYDYAIQLDGDGQHDPRYIETMVAEIESKSCDMVIGSRFLYKKKPKSVRMTGSNIIQI
ncbi:MAG: glycosyltransferase family 2 protein, partial [Clostridiales bacterium]|nr:glycosyltransferase family 2 protein [Clostridiales bacterium]